MVAGDRPQCQLRAHRAADRARRLRRPIGRDGHRGARLGGAARHRLLACRLAGRHGRRRFRRHARLSRRRSATRAPILLYVEAITQARKFMSAARAAARAASRCIAIKAGRHADGARRPRPRIPARWPASDAVYDAAFRRAGMLRVDDLDELFDAVETLALTPAAARRPARDPDQWRRRRRAGDRRADRRRAASSPTLSPETIARARRGAAAHLVPRQSGRHHRRRRRRSAMPTRSSILLDDARHRRGPGAQLPDRARLGRRGGARGDRCGGARPSAARPQRARPPGSASSRRRGAAALRRGGIPTYDTPDAAVRGFMHLVQLPPQPGAADGDAAVAAGRVRARRARRRAGDRARRWPQARPGSTPTRSQRVLAAYGIPAPRSRIAADADEAAAAAAARSAGRSRSRSCSPDITHKSDVGGVALDLGDAERGARRGRGDAGAGRARRARGAASTASWCSRWSRGPGAIELILGIGEDAGVRPGPAVRPGRHRGRGDRRQGARAAAAQPRAGRGRRWRARASAACCRAIATARRPISTRSRRRWSQLSQLVADLAEIAELDINPLLADAAGVLALDARIRVAPGGAAGRGAARHPPYPRELESARPLRDGTRSCCCGRSGPRTSRLLQRSRRST